MTFPFNDAEADVLVSGLVLNFVPDTQAGFQEMCRTVRTRGTVPLCVWDYAGEKQRMRYFWNAVSGLFPEGEVHDEAKQF